MATNKNQTSRGIAHLAAETLNNRASSQVAKTLAAAALAQTGNAKQTGATVEAVAGRALESKHSAAATKQLAASVLSQSNKSS